MENRVLLNVTSEVTSVARLGLGSPAVPVYAVSCNDEMCWVSGTCWQEGDGAWALWSLVGCCYRVQGATIQAETLCPVVNEP